MPITGVACTPAATTLIGKMPICSEVQVLAVQEPVPVAVTNSKTAPSVTSSIR